jgi:plasmid maintenance system killer protein
LTQLDVQVFFRSKKLQKICSSAREIQKVFGAARSRKLQQRLLELSAAENLSQISRLPPSRCHEMTGDRQGQLSVDLDHPYRLFFIPANDPVPRREDGGLDWPAVTEIEILEIEDPH